MIASLPMYDFEEVRAQTDLLWATIRHAVAARMPHAALPDRLTRPVDQLLAHWLRPDIALSQSCGLPVAQSFTDAQHVLGSFDFDACEPDRPGWYRTLIVCRTDDPRGDRGPSAFDGCSAAVNDGTSLSGWGSLGAALFDAGVRASSVIATGAHVSSAEALRGGLADVASIDPHTFELLATHRPMAVAGLRVIGRGPLVAATPLFTAYAELVAPMRDAIGDAVSGLRDTTRRALLVRGWVPHGSDVHDHTLELATRARVAFGIGS